MNPAPKIIPSGIKPAKPFYALRAAFDSAAQAAIDELERAQAAALERLEQFTPTERLLTLKEAAIYLQFSPRTIDEYTRGESPKIQFAILGGEKRFRLRWLDEAVESRAVKPRKVAL